jgi:glycosyltransferase involved in cell wall biosynthesis
MRIAHVILSRGFAGSERATAELCNAQVSAHPVLLVLRRDHVGHGGASIRQWLDPAVQVVEIGVWLQRAPLAAALAAFRPDVIHAHLRRSTRLLSQIAPAAVTIATLHLTVNGPHFADMGGLICICDWQRHDIPPAYPGRVFHINESLIPHRRLPEEERLRLRHELGAAAGCYLVGAAGRLTHSKGFDLLIEAFARARLPQARLAIIGEGRQRRRLRRQAGPGVVLTGFRDNIKDCYQAFDLFVSPSRREPLSRVILEALDAGTPVVAAACLGPSELLAKFPGDLFPIGDIDALSRLLSQHYAQRTGQRSSDLSAYHIDLVARETEAAYRTLLASRP